MREAGLVLTDLARRTVEASIAKWEAVRRGDISSHSFHDCPMCAVYLKDSCVGCPVMLRTGQPGCKGAPYETEWAPLVDADDSGFADTPEKLTAAQSIIDFLNDLLAEEQA